MINKSIFKAYDVRGIYPTDLNEDAAYQSGKAFVRLSGAKNLVIGHDARLSSPALFNALAAGVLAEGAQVTSIGQVPTEGVYFAIGRYDFDGAIMITASHNPKEYNGFKMMRKQGNDIIWIRGKELLDSVEDGEVKPLEQEIPQKDILQDYISHLFTGVDATAIKPFKIVVDASNGVMGKVITNIKDKLPVQITELNFNPDGNFPNHSPNPLEKGSVDQIAAEIKKQGADFGVMFDGDADRIFLVDERGVILSSDITRLLLIKYYLQKKPGAAVVYDLICSRAVKDFIEKWGGKPVKAPVGFVNVREELIKHQGVMGGELSGHFCFADYFYMDSGMMAFLTLLQIISQSDKPLSEMAKEFIVYASCPVINFKIADTAPVLEKVKAKYNDGKQDEMDGVTVEYDDWWFNLRPSNTEPLIKLTIEANTQELLGEKVKELSDFINS